MENATNQANDSRITIRISESLKLELEKEANSHGTTLAKAASKRLMAPNKFSEITTVNYSKKQEFAFESYLELIKKCSDQFRETLSTAEDSISVAATDCIYSINQKSKSLINTVEETRTTMKNGSRKWEEVVDGINSLEKFFNEIGSISGDFRRDKKESALEFSRFKKSLIFETHEYRKNLNRFAVKHYCLGLVFIAIGTALSIWIPKYN